MAKQRTFHCCQHIKSQGERCKLPVIGRSQFCYWHSRLHDVHFTYQPGDQCYQVPTLESGNDVQMALMQVLTALMNRTIDIAMARTAFYGLQLAMANLKNMKETFADYAATELTPAMADSIVMPLEPRTEPAEPAQSAPKSKSNSDGSAGDSPATNIAAPSGSASSASLRTPRNASQSAADLHSHDNVKRTNNLHCHADSKRSGEEVHLPSPRSSDFVTLPKLPVLSADMPRHEIQAALSKIARDALKSM